MHVCSQRPCNTDACANHSFVSTDSPSKLSFTAPIWAYQEDVAFHAPSWRTELHNGRICSCFNYLIQMSFCALKTLTYYFCKCDTRSRLSFKVELTNLSLSPDIIFIIIETVLTKITRFFRSIYFKHISFQLSRFFDIRYRHILTVLSIWNLR